VAHKVADETAANEIYKGIAPGVSGGNDSLYATDFHEGHIDLFNCTFANASRAGSFSDTSIPVGFALSFVQNIGGQLYVTYAKQMPMPRTMTPASAGGFVDRFGTSGNLVKRLVSQGDLNSP
jgi:uncharacterized protein (TIGR03118 family)